MALSVQKHQRARISTKHLLKKPSQMKNYERVQISDIFILIGRVLSSRENKCIVKVSE